MLLNIHCSFIRTFIRKPFVLPQILGVSDGVLMESALKKIYKSNYVNFHYHKEPHLDVTCIPPHIMNSADIVSCTEVLEHVAAPVELAFQGLRDLLKKNGRLILSVPHGDANSQHIEHFPVMNDFEITLGDNPKLVGKLENGQSVVFHNLRFHGGIGSTLEFRVFSEKSLVEQLRNSNFGSFRPNRDSKFFGISWEKWSRVWICTVD